METMSLDDDSGAHEGNDEDNGDDGYGIESHVWCTARFTTPPNCGPVSGVNTDNERSLWTNSDCMYVLQ